LKNDGVLPFTSTTRKIAVVGPLAESTKVLHGNYSGTASHAVTALEGIRKQFGADVAFSPGTNFLRKPAVIPTSALSTSDGQPGLKGEYFASKDFSKFELIVNLTTAKTLGIRLPTALTARADEIVD
jgi:beta-glucosidase